MQLFESREGFIFSFGFNMQTRKPDSYYIGWCDPMTKEWGPGGDNGAGWIQTPFMIFPSKIEQPKDGHIVVHQSNYIVLLHNLGSPLYWNMTPYQPERALREGIIKAPEDWKLWMG